MKQITSDNLASSIKGVPSHGPMSSGSMTEDQKAAVQHFFRRLRLVSPSWYDSQYSGDAAAAVRQNFSRHIIDMSFDQINAGLDGFSVAIQSGEIKYLKIDEAIGYCKRWGKPVTKETKPAGLYKHFPRSRSLPDEKTLEARRKASKIGIERLKGIVSDIEKAPTADEFESSRRDAIRQLKKMKEKRDV